MTGQYVSHNEADIWQATWLHQSYVVGHPAEMAGQYAEALSSYELLVKLDPGHILSHLLRGTALLNLERKVEGRAALRRALELAKQELQRDASNAHAWLYQGDALWMLEPDEEDPGRPDAALESYQQALLLAPDLPEIYVSRGWLWHVCARHEEARRDFERALSLDPHDPDIFYRLGCVFWESGQYTRAWHAVERAVVLDPDFISGYSLLAITLSSLGREEEAEIAEARHQQLLTQSRASRGPAS